MKPSESTRTFRSFEDLKCLLDEEAECSLPSCPPQPPVDPAPSPPDPEADHRLFLEAMADVTPLSGECRVEPDPQIKTPPIREDNSDAAALARLEKLVEEGAGYVVSHTPEYIEGTGHCVHPMMTQLLHRGDFSIQAHLDLHGLSVDGAREAFEDFLRRAIAAGQRGVLIVHGRGLSSPSEPVLKTKVSEWLTRGPWRKWIIAFSSAQACDGGAGATYVLLRHRPFTKRFRRRRSRRRARNGSPGGGSG